jgi:hypothetical protein
MNSLTQSLLKKGDNIAVHQGQLIITPRSGKPVPNNWFSMNSQKIVSEIAQQQNQSIFTYCYYKTGIYNNGRSPGVMIRFVDLLTGENVFAMFNANLKRQRKTKRHHAGEPLPEGQFCIGKRSALYMLWMRTDLEIPRRFAEWHKSMSKLQHVYFVAERSANDKLSNQSIRPLSLSLNQLRQLFGDSAVTREGQASDNLVTRNGDKDRGQELVTRDGDKDVATDHTTNGLTHDPKCVSKQVRVFESAGDLSACQNKYVQRNQVMTCNVVPLTPNKMVPEEQSVDEWLQDYDSAS